MACPARGPWQHTPVWVPYTKYSAPWCRDGCWLNPAVVVQAEPSELITPTRHAGGSEGGMRRFALRVP